MDPVVLSEAQFNVLMKLSRGDRVTVIPPVTRKWLQRMGYITVQRLNGGHQLQIEITDLGREIITHAVSAAKS
jgi:hypothetical protein